MQVIKCTQALEAKAQENPNLEIYNLYSASAPTDHFNELRQKLNEDVEDSTCTYSLLMEYPAVCIANIFKKFLRELPDPIIPVQWYDHFIEAISMFCLTN